MQEQPGEQAHCSQTASRTTCGQAYTIAKTALP
jgi:hypothetical protein